MTVSILHLTDIHAGPGELADEDNKIHVSGAERRKQLTRLEGYVSALPNVPDFVIVSGDITIKGNAKGLEDFRNWLLRLIESKSLPPAERIIVTPGNHDVARQKRSGYSQQARFNSFMEILGKAFPHAHLPGCDPDLNPNKPKIPKTSRKPLGGIQSYTRAGRVSLSSSFPFLLDLQRDVLIFAFNSSHACGIPLSPDEKILAPLKGLAQLHETDNEGPKIHQIIDMYLDSLVIDAGLITDSQIGYFTALMGRLRRDLGKEKYSRLTKIAFLHHHVSHLWKQQIELKTFESILDASQLKQALIENEYDFVLHGHKHTNHVGLDGALIPLSRKGPFSPLCIVSGGTVGGHPRLNDQQSFKLLTLHGKRGPRTKATIKEIPILDTANYALALQRDARIYQAPVAQRLPQLHDLSALKERLDVELQEHCAPELKDHSKIVSKGSKLPPANKHIIANSLGYEYHSHIEGHIKGNRQTIFYESFLVTRKIPFGLIARIYWLVNDVTALPPRRDHRRIVVVAIGDLGGTHFFQGMIKGEISDSIADLKRHFEPAIKEEILSIRSHKFSQKELEAISRTMDAGADHDR